MDTMKQTQQDTSNREAFEAAYRKRYRVPAHVPLTFPDVEPAWEWWLAAALAHAAPAVGAPVAIWRKLEAHKAHDLMPTDLVYRVADVEALDPTLAASESFPYQRTFNAIADATEIQGGHIAISVVDFRAAMADTPTAASAEGATLDDLDTFGPGHGGMVRGGDYVLLDDVLRAIAATPAASLREHGSYPTCASHNYTHGLTADMLIPSLVAAHQRAEETYDDAGRRTAFMQGCHYTALEVRTALAAAPKAPAAPEGEAVGSVYTMEAFDRPRDVKSHVQLYKQLPAGTKLYTHPADDPPGWKRTASGWERTGEEAS